MGTAMNGVNQVNVFGAPGNQVADVMQDARAQIVPKAKLFTAGTALSPKIATPPQDLGLRQILGTDDPLGAVGKILSRSRHGVALLGNISLPRKLQDLLHRVTTGFPTMMLKTLKKGRSWSIRFRTYSLSPTGTSSQPS